MFANVILPEVTVSEMRGVMALLALIANPESKTAADFLMKLATEKDAAIEAARAAATDRVATEALARELTTLQAREAAVTQRESALADAQADLGRREAEHRSRVQALVAIASAV